MPSFTFIHLPVSKHLQSIVSMSDMASPFQVVMVTGDHPDTARAIACTLSQNL